MEYVLCVIHWFRFSNFIEWCNSINDLKFIYALMPSTTIPSEPNGNIENQFLHASWIVRWNRKKKKMMGLDFEMGEHRRRSSILTPLFVRHFSGVKWFQTSICMSGRVWVRVIVAQRTEPEQKHTAEWQTFVRCANSMWPWTMWNKNIIKCEQANSYTTNRWRYDLYTFRLRHRALFGHCYCSAIC